jgi:histidine triad (HIT) family protein
MSSSSCAFCNVISGSAPAQVVWTSDEAIAFLDRSPINPGHLLVVPRAHVATLWDLEEPKFIQLLLIVRRLAVSLAEVLNVDRAGMAVEGYGVPHAHIHLVPINGGHELDPCRQSPASEDDLERMGQLIRVHFSKVLQ